MLARHAGLPTATPKIICDYMWSQSEVATIRTMQLRDPKAQLSQVVDEATKGEPVTITRHGTEVAMVVSMEDHRSSKFPELSRALFKEPSS